MRAVSDRGRIAAAALSADQYTEAVAMVSAMCSGLLGREPDAAGRGTWASTLLRPATPRFR